MKRQIKFRGKNRKTGKWIYGDLLTPITGCRIVNYTEEDKASMKRADYNYHDVFDDTIGQFTGLKAEDNEELYEGDIVEICCFDYNGTDYHYRAYVDFYMGEFILYVTHQIYYQWKNNELHKTVSKYKENEATPCWSLAEMYIGCCYSGGAIGNCDDIKIVGNIHDNPELIDNHQSKS